MGTAVSSLRNIPSVSLVYRLLQAWSRKVYGLRYQEYINKSHQYSHILKSVEHTDDIYAIFYVFDVVICFWWPLDGWLEGQLDIYIARKCYFGGFVMSNANVFSFIGWLVGWLVGLLID